MVDYFKSHLSQLQFCLFVKLCYLYLVFVLFHSTGMGRTGTYIAIDQLVDELRHNGNADVMKTISAMGESTSKTVETLVSLM